MRNEGPEKIEGEGSFVFVTLCSRVIFPEEIK
jgi:hypothetical protein